MRPRWIPYFDNVSAIIFLAPLAFDQFLEEDHLVNRLEDSFQLWTEVCRNKLLRRVTLVLLLNKRDVLAQTLDEGIQVRKFIPSYKGPNELGAVTSYFRQKFMDVHVRLFRAQSVDT
jgi:guanine nucleotide-binding protein alpha-1 subunit